MYLFIFVGLTFEILGYDEIEPIKESIEKASGKVISKCSNEIPDYTIVPVEGTNIKPNSKNVVSIIFVVSNLYLNNKNFVTHIISKTDFYIKVCLTVS